MCGGADLGQAISRGDTGLQKIRSLKFVTYPAQGSPLISHSFRLDAARSSVNGRYTLPAATTLHLPNGEPLVFEGLSQATAMARMGGLVLGHRSTSHVAV